MVNKKEKLSKYIFLNKINIVFPTISYLQPETLPRDL